MNPLDRPVAVTDTYREASYPLMPGPKAKVRPRDVLAALDDEPREALAEHAAEVIGHCFQQGRSEPEYIARAVVHAICPKRGDA